MSSHLANSWNPSSIAPIPPSLNTDPHRRTQENRLHYWVDFCRDEYRLDPIHSKLIASALIPCSPHKPVWLIAETSSGPFWDHLSTSMASIGLPRITNLTGLRTIRPRYANQYATDWMTTRQTHPRIFIDTHFQTPDCWRGLLTRHPYWQVSAQCIRVPIPVPLSRIPAPGVEQEMARWLRMVLDRNPSRQFQNTAQVIPAPVALSPVQLEFIELLPRLNPELADTSALLANLSLLPSSYAAMHSRATLADDDWWNMSRCLRGCVRQWTRQLLGAFYNNPGQMLTHHDLVIHSGLSEKVVGEEAARLEQTGVLRKRKMPNTKRIWLYGPTEGLGVSAVSMVGAENVKWA
jgi:hypothetical protein